MSMPPKPYKNVICNMCGSEFRCKDTKRNLNRKFCSRKCACTNNGLSNKGRKHTEKFKENHREIFSGDKNPFYGKTHSKESKDKISIANKGVLSREKHPNWKGGIKHRPDGYLRYSDNDQYVHRRIMENYLGRKLLKDEHVHHIDGNPRNNDIDNLVVSKNTEHSKMHAAKRERDKFGRFK